MCLITSPKDREEYIKETYIAPRPASSLSTRSHSRRSHSQVYAYRDGTFSREYTNPIAPTVVRSEYARSDYTPSLHSHRSRSPSSRRSSKAYITGAPVASTSPTRVLRKVQYDPTGREMVPVARTESVYVTEEITPTSMVEVLPLPSQRRERVENVYTTRRVSPAVVVEERRRRRRGSQVYY